MERQGSKRAATLWVRTPRARYPVWVASGLLRRCGRRLRELRPGARRVFVVSSPRVWALWGSELAHSLRAARLQTETVLFTDAEENKRTRTVEKLAEQLLARGADRNAVLVALGGGVVGDVTGFLAASYMRGVDYVQVPTTLVGQIDSAIGGKTGVNLRGGKNLLGAFHHPRAVVADPRALTTLPAREYRAGLYEVVKGSVIGDAKLFSFLEDNMDAVLARQPAALRTVLRRSIALKARIVGADERERGLRRILNFGHTVGHALETLSGYQGLRHGEAVGWGMLAATCLAVQQGLLAAAAGERIRALVLAVGKLPPGPRVSAERVYEQLFADKKKDAGALRFVLPRGIGRVVVVSDVPRARVLRCLRALSGSRTKR